MYGREGNTLYLLLARSMWWCTRRLPHGALAMLVSALYPVFWCYLQAARWLPLPLANYMRRVMLPLTPAKRRVVIYDQLNPAYAKYYTRDEAREALAKVGFADLRLLLSEAGLQIGNLQPGHQRPRRDTVALVRGNLFEEAGHRGP